jgi:hypothetical protein
VRHDINYGEREFVHNRKSQYLSVKFGTEYHIDLLLNDDSAENGNFCSNFFSQQLPSHKLIIQRPVSRLYTISSSTMVLSNLFKIMENDKKSICGFHYYTCSTSSLERVFMEIIRMSEQEDDVQEEIQHYT